MPTGAYAELRECVKLSICACRRTDKGEEPSAEWIAVYFPEYKGIYTNT